MWQTISELPVQIPFQPRPVAVVGCGEYFCAVSRHSPVSTHPSTYMISLSKKSATARSILEKKEFALQFLDSSHLHAIDFSGRIHGDETDKWETSRLHRKNPSKITTPLIEEAFAIYECRVSDILEKGDHTVFFADVIILHLRNDIRYPEDVHAPLYFGKQFYAENTPPQHFQSEYLPS